MSTTTDTVQVQEYQKALARRKRKDTSLVCFGSDSEDADEAVDGIGELEAESIIGLTISRTQSDARHVVAPVSNVDGEEMTINRNINEQRKETEDANKTEIDKKHKEIEKSKSPERVAFDFKKASTAPSFGIYSHSQEASSRNRNGNGMNGSVGKRSSLLNFSLPSFQLPNLGLPSAPAFLTSEGRSHFRKRSRTIRMSSSKNEDSPKGSPFDSSSTFGMQQLPSSQEDVHGRNPLLRRASSTPSLQSYASSVGNDSKFAGVSSMTNSRLKAIKDSFLDGLPDLSQFSIANATSAISSYASSTKNSLIGGPADIGTGPTTAKLNSNLPQPKPHPLDMVQGDIVILGGYRGSTLRDKATGRLVWIPLKVGLNLRKVNLEVGLEPEDELEMSEKIVADGMLANIGPVDISRRLLRRLRSGQAKPNEDRSHLGRRVHEWAYDWRLSPALLSKQFIEFLEGLQCNQGKAQENRTRGRGALVIAHSLGGLITRHAINQRPDLFSGVLYAGVPQYCVNILGPLKNGDTVLLSSRVLTAQVNFTLRSSFVLLPEHDKCFIDKETGKELPLDFFDVENWIKYGLSPCVSKHQASYSYSHSHPRHPAPLQSTVANQVEQSVTKDRSIAPQIDASSHQPARTHAHPPLATSFPSLPITLTPSLPFFDDPPPIPVEKAIPYLKRTLLETKKFKQELHAQPSIEHGIGYPPTAVLYGKSIPTVKGARVLGGLYGIRKENAYDDLIFGAGDGVCLAKAAMLPTGYPKEVVKICIERGHVGLLGDLDGVGKCVEGIVYARGW